MLRYLRILQARLKVAVALSAQYRWDFLIDGLLSILWIFVGLIPLFIAFENTPSVKGWSYPETLLVVGWFTALKGFFSAMFFPSLLELATRIRDGTLDFLITKPANALFLISTSRFELWRLVDSLGGAAVIIWAFILWGQPPSLKGVLLALLLLMASFIVLYSLCVLVASMAFWAIRMEGLPYVFHSVLDFGRWPVTFFHGLARVVFTYIIPLAILTTYPAAAVLGRPLSAATVAWAILGALALFLVASLLFSRALGSYTSASS